MRREAAAGLLAVVLAAGCEAKKDAAATSPVASSPAAAYAGPRFEEVAHASGVDFRMRFLPDEQGENFKINLYDHGCGVAVADVDGDGKDDVFFCNQLGPCALYRNDGTGKFTDVTKES